MAVLLSIRSIDILRESIIRLNCLSQGKSKLKTLQVLYYQDILIRAWLSTFNKAKIMF
jgi:hypothetical protein